jgi:demethylmenaquinone methyltransferase/2-methoxy-6-polyprenyl-1,4-benzoquinol methylase
MLPIARRKSRSMFVERWDASGHNEWLTSDAFVRFVTGDAQALPLPDACCDVVSIAFGIRNVADPAVAIREFFRVLRPGGRLIILEFSLPTNPLLRGLYNFYFRKILPRTATFISGDKTGAYKYLPESVNTFIGREQMAGMMRDAGFADVTQHPMTFGVCVAYRGIKGG